MRRSSLFRPVLLALATVLFTATLACRPTPDVPEPPDEEGPSVLELEPCGTPRLEIVETGEPRLAGEVTLRFTCTERDPGSCGLDDTCEPSWQGTGNGYALTCLCSNLNLDGLERPPRPEDFE